MGKHCFRQCSMKIVNNYIELKIINVICELNDLSRILVV